MRQFLIGCALCMFVLIGLAGVFALPQLKAFAREQGLLEKTEEQKFAEFAKELAVREQSSRQIEGAYTLQGDGATLIAEIGAEAARGSLVDPYSAVFRDVIVAHDSSKREVVVCGIVNAKNRLGAFAGDAPFIVSVHVGSRLEGTKSSYVLFEQNIEQVFFDTFSDLRMPSDWTFNWFKNRCGLAFSTKIITLVS